MKRDSAWKHFAIVGVLAVTGYFVVFNWIEHRRFKKGPWTVAFSQTNGAPLLRINQHALGITNVTLLFADTQATTNANETVAFGQGRAVPFDLPHGRCVFLDPLFLPGTMACEIGGHTVQLMPRVLTIDGVERPWVSDETIALTNAPSTAVQR